MNLRRLGLSLHPLLARADGITMLVVLLVLMTLSVLGLFGAYKTQTEIRIAHNDLRTKQALAAAEAGLNHAFALIKQGAVDGFTNELSNGGTGGSLVSLGSPLTIDGISYLSHHFGNGVDDGYAVRVEDNFDETSGGNDPTKDTDMRLKIIAIGRVGGAERIVEAMVEGESPFGTGIFGKLFVKTAGGSMVDSFDCKNGPYGGTNVGAEGNVRSNGNITLGGANSGIHGNATAGGIVDIGNGAITGTTTNNAPPLTFPPVLPCGPPYSSGSNLHLPAGDSYNSATGELKGNSGATIVLANGTYCFSRMTLGAGTSIRVNGPVTIYLTGKSDMSAGSVQNTTRLASNLRLYSSGAGSSEEISLSGNSVAYMAVYAPTAGVQLTGGSDFFGAIIADSIQTTGGTNLHYDKCLANTPFGELKLTNWNDVRE
ncbi:MAG: hypothetical protein AB7G75_19015 [Candidatus Binatia bacterium]